MVKFVNQCVVILIKAASFSLPPEKYAINRSEQF
jgi:hypothetical protein